MIKICNINSLFVKNKDLVVTPFLMSVTANSFSSNNHGEGIYTNSDNQVIKSKHKINLIELGNQIENSDVIITHQRYSTSGFEIDYNHPFANDNFVLVHNGIINQFLGKVGSDTFGFWNKFNKEFNSITSHISRSQKIVQVISKLFEKDEGSYSILIYDKKTKNSFYFKGDNYPGINFYTNDDYLFVTTNNDNKHFISLLSSKKYKTLKINNRTIYRIDENFQVLKTHELPKVKIEKKEIVSTWNGSYGGWENTGQTVLVNNKSEIVGGCNFCDTCNKVIWDDDYGIINGQTVCEKCLKLNEDIFRGGN